MSSVIAFPSKLVRPASETAMQGPADVIIFPGVRIERMAYDLSERLPTMRVGTKQTAHAKEFDFY
jgi:hypothetical protein